MELVADTDLERPHVAATAAPEAAVLSGPQRFAFTGTGEEYFRIWVVNLLLTLATLGIYSAWAKVRRLQYFYRNTRVAGAIFDYHGKPGAILRGRLLALVLLAAYQVASEVSVTATVVVVALLLLVTPWLLARAFRFKLANSSYRGLRFHFRGTTGEAYRMLMLFPLVLAVVGVFVWSVATSFSARPGLGTILLVVLLPVIAVAGTVPLAHYFLKRYQHDNADYGQSPFFFHARGRDFFSIYAKAFGLLLLAGILAALCGSLLGGWWLAALGALLAVYTSYLFVLPYMGSRIQNLVWKSTELSFHRFESTVSARRLLWIHVSNLVLIVLTLGLYKPFATVRVIKYRVESMTLVPDGDLEEFLAAQATENIGAMGQEAGDLFDIDIAL